MNDEDRKPTTKLPAVRPGSAPTLLANETLAQKEARILGTRHASLDGRVEIVERVIGVPRPAPRPPPAKEAVIVPREKLKSTSEDEQEKTEGGLIAHTRRLEAEIREHKEEQKAAMASQNQVLAMFARDFGLEDKLPTQMQTSLPPPPEGPLAPPKTSVIAEIARRANAIDRRAKHSQFVQVLVALAVLVEAVQRLIAFIHP